MFLWDRIRIFLTCGYVHNQAQLLNLQAVPRYVGSHYQLARRKRTTTLGILGTFMVPNSLGIK